MIQVSFAGLRRATAAVAVVVASAQPATLAGQTQKRLTIAAASDLQTALPAIARAFEQTGAARATLTFASSGTLFAQIRNGAPFDVFLSADGDYPRRLARENVGDPSTLQQYASGFLALWARRDSGIDVNRGLNGLTDARVRRIAVANPATAPYGRAAVSALRTAQLYDAVQAKLVFGENLAQAAQLVESGNADVGILSLAAALGPTMRAEGIFFRIPAVAYPPIEQWAVIVRSSREPALARRFLAYLREPQANAMLTRFGFSVPARR
jgi:molybdate transport system substrate-binding protein